jgi:hypothetical protein
LAETASEDCVLATAFGSLARARRQFSQLQFHWGKPPPAADPRTITFIAHKVVTDGRAAGYRRSELGAGVAVDFHADGNLDDFRALPLPHVGSSFRLAKQKLCL